MHTFTKQQRQGGARYQPRTLVGNWSEELSQYAANMHAFLESKRAGTLQMDAHTQKLQTGLAPAELGPPRSDSLVHLGDVLQLMHAHTGAALAVDVDDTDTRPGATACAASASADPRSQQPVARSTLLLAKVPRAQLGALEPCRDSESGDVLRYGERIRLFANPMAQGEPLLVSVDGSSSAGTKPLALYSSHVQPTCAARSGHQLVGFTWQHQGFDSVWQVQPLDPADVLAAEGHPVEAGVPVVLLHCATHAPLAIDAGVPHPSDFGIELEVSCHAESSHGKQLHLEHTARGEDLRVLPKAKLGSNHWVFVTHAVVAKQLQE